LDRAGNTHAVDDEAVETNGLALFEKRDEPGVRDRLIEQYLPLAQNLAKRYMHSGQSLDDLIQVACVGLINAVDRFDASRGVGFHSFAVPTILGELKRYHRDRGWSIRVPRRLQENALIVKNAVPILCQETGRSPTIAELSECTALSEEEVLEAIEAQEAYASVSLDATFDGDGESSSLTERLAIDDAEMEFADEWVEIVAIMRQLPVRERRIVALRFFADRTQSEIAAELGISQMHVSRLLRRALLSLREKLGDSPDDVPDGARKLISAAAASR
jgi:RNA polymerase sigma-B factor